MGFYTTPTQLSLDDVPALLVAEDLRNPSYIISGTNRHLSRIFHIPHARLERDQSPCQDLNPQLVQVV
jgi:hypothetical protein